VGACLYAGGDFSTVCSAPSPDNAPCAAAGPPTAAPAPAGAARWCRRDAPGGAPGGGCFGAALGAAWAGAAAACARVRFDGWEPLDGPPGAVRALAPMD
jgi:hypothetical protein